MDATKTCVKTSFSSTWKYKLIARISNECSIDVVGNTCQYDYVSVDNDTKIAISF